jgi:hypothetical protein
MTHRDSVLKKLGLSKDGHYSLMQLSTFSGVPLSILERVYSRGLGAAASNPQSVRIRGTFVKNPDMKRFPRSARLSAPQWAMARVYSFLDKGRTYYTADADLAREAAVMRGQ